jgi:hypothetical protein
LELFNINKIFLLFWFWTCNIIWRLKNYLCISLRKWKLFLISYKIINGKKLGKYSSSYLIFCKDSTANWFYIHIFWRFSPMVEWILSLDLDCPIIIRINPIRDEMYRNIRAKSDLTARSNKLKIGVDTDNMNSGRIFLLWMKNQINKPYHNLTWSI